MPSENGLPTHEDLPSSSDEMLEDLSRRLMFAQHLVERERTRADKLAARLRQLGVDPDKV